MIGISASQTLGHPMLEPHVSN